MSETDLDRLRGLAEALREEAPPAIPSGLSERGIVICAGGARIFTNAYVLIRLLRDTLDCALPIELWHFGRSEISPAMASTLDGLGVSLIDALPLIETKGSRIRDGWQLKPFAMLWSRFEEALLLDADQVPIADPAELFEWPEYRQTGAVFWPDIVGIRSDNPVWQAFQLVPAEAPSFESGQVLVNKSLHWGSLYATLRLNEEADLLYRLIYGDKDTFLLGWQILGASYALVPHQPYIDSRYLVQRDFAGEPVFQHRTNAKWIYAGEQIRLPGFVHEAACLAFLAELREVWGGRLFNAPDRSVAARQAEITMAAQRFFLMNTGERGTTALELRPYGEIGGGRSHDRQNWWIEVQNGDLTLILHDGDSSTHRLRRVDETYWLGERLLTPIDRLVLKPVEKREGAAIAPRRPLTLLDEVLWAAQLTDPEWESPALVDALNLLARIVPGLADELRQRADGEPDSKVAHRLATLAERLSAVKSPPLQRSTLDVLHAGYARNTGGAWQ